MTSPVKDRAANKVQLREVSLRLFLRYYRYLMMVVVIIILSAGYAFVINDKLNHVRTVSVGDYRRKERELTAQQGYRDQLRAMAQKFQQEVTAEDRALLNRALPEGPQIPNLMSALNDITTQTNYTIDSLGFTEESSSSSTAGDTSSEDIQGVLKAVRGETTNNIGQKLNAKNLTVRLSLRGPSDYASLKKLMAAIESSERLLDVGALSFTLGSTSSDVTLASGTTHFDLTITTPYLPVTAPST